MAPISHASRAMRPLLRVLLPVAIALAVVTGAAWWIVERTARAWFEPDAVRDTESIARGVAPRLAPWLAAGERIRTRALLDELLLDERVVAATACGAGFVELARTERLPAAARCDALARTASATDATSGGTTRAARLGDVHVAVAPIALDGRQVGALVVVHDLTVADRRAAAVRWFVLAALGLLVTATALITWLSPRLLRRRWTRDMRRALAGEDAPREFRPLLADLRELASQLATVEAEGGDRRWGPERLRQLLTDQMPGDRVLILANREPYIHRRTATGEVRVSHPASGLVTALEPVMRACAGTWIAHGSGDADRATVDDHDHIAVPPGEAAYTLRRIWLRPDEERGYYYGFANEGLWPLCHLAHTRPIFRADDWQHYQRVNQRFVDAAVEEAGQPDPVVLVQDYHFAMAPAQLREALPRATVITFWHIPWPSAERVAICPQRRALLEGVLGSNIIGFHTQGHCHNFLEAVDRFLEARIDRESQTIFHRGRKTLVRAYPISVEWPSRWAAAAPPIAACRAAARAGLGLPADCLIGLGVDRLDYTKGIEERLLAVEQLLVDHPELRGRFTFVQVAAPSRTELASYRDLDAVVEAAAARINQRFPGKVPPITLLREHHEPAQLFAYYRAAELCYVSSLHDGMNLVAKEFVAARDDERGVLVLSSFAGAARELTEALIVNPYDIEQASRALHRALVMDPVEQAGRMRAMRELVAEFNVYRWAGRMLVDAARLRRQQRLSAAREAA